MLNKYVLSNVLIVNLDILILISSLSLSQQLPVITSNTIVRCRSCRTYINPFVSFLDQRRWKCNLCYRVNDGKTRLTIGTLQDSTGPDHKPVSQMFISSFTASVPGLA